MTNVMKNMFGPVKAGLCRLSVNGNVAIKTDSGYKTYDATTGAFINCDDFVFDIGDEMFFVIPTNAVAVGDIILTAENKPCYVLEVNDDKITAINYQKGTIDTIIPERHMFMGNTYFYGKVVSMFGNFAKGDNQAENVMKYMMINQMMKGGTNNGFNPMMFMLMGNNGIVNIFGDMFGGIANNKTKDEVKEG